MSILTRLGIDNQQDLKPRFNERVYGLIGRLRKDEFDIAAGNEMAKLVEDLCEHFISRHYVRIPPQLDQQEVIQEVNIKFMMASRKPENDITNSYDYISSILRNHVIGSQRGTKVLVDSQLVNADDEATGLMSGLESDGRDGGRRHAQDDLHRDLREEYGDQVEDLIRNNGFTSHEKVRVKQEITMLDRAHSGHNYKMMLEKYYFGDLLKPQLYSRLQRELGIPEGTVKRQMFLAQKLLDEAIAEHIEQPARGELEEKLKHVREFRSSFKGTHQEGPAVQPVAPDKDDEPSVGAASHASGAVPHEKLPIGDLPVRNIPHGRHFIAPTEMMRRMHHNATPERLYQLHKVLLEMLSKRSEENITLTDGIVRKAQQVFIPHMHERGGRHTIFIDEQAQEFLEAELHATHDTHPKGWMSVTAFDHFIGRSNKRESLQKTFDFLYDLWLNLGTVTVDGRERPARMFINFFDPYQGHKPGQFMQGKELPKDEHIEGKMMYISPELRDFAREHLPYHPEEKQEGWLRIAGQHGGVLEHLHVYRKPTREKKMADHMAVVGLLKEFKQRGTFEMGDPPRQCKVSDYLGQFMIAGSISPLEADGIWLVSPEILGEGKPITKDMVVAKSKEILERPDDFPGFKEAAQGARKKQ